MVSDASDRTSEEVAALPVKRGISSVPVLDEDDDVLARPDREIERGPSELLHDEVRLGE